MTVRRASIRREGHVRVPTGHLEAADTATPIGDDGPLRLGQWVIAQRAYGKTDDLPAVRIKQLEDIPGWVWDMRVYAWECGLEALLDFVKTHGHAQVPARHVHHGDKLGSWLMTRRRSIGLGASFKSTELLRWRPSVSGRSSVTSPLL